jgi:hypothetical protein
MDSISNIISAQSSNFYSPGAPVSQQAKPAEVSLSEEIKTETQSLARQSEKNNLNLDAIKTGLQSLRIQLDALLELIDENKNSGNASSVIAASAPRILTPVVPSLPNTPVRTPGSERVLEGIFNGEKMVGRDGKEYAVPPNYASKSKLVDGDTLKLTITPNGSFIYKQINQTPRVRLVGSLVKDQVNNQWKILAGGKQYRVLTASVTFYRGKQGDEVFFLAPKEKNSEWAAVENIVSVY